MAPFAELEADFLRITGETVFCTATTVDGRGRPRGRMLHPVFTVEDGLPIGWAITAPTPLKAAHLAANPHMSCSFWNPSQDTVLIDCVTEWIASDAECQHVFELFRDTPTPLGWGREGMAGYGSERWRSELFAALRLSPWRVQVMRGEEYPAGNLAGRVWHRDC